MTWKHITDRCALCESISSPSASFSSLPLINKPQEISPSFPTSITVVTFLSFRIPAGANNQVWGQRLGHDPSIYQSISLIKTTLRDRRHSIAGRVHALHTVGPSLISSISYGSPQAHPGVIPEHD